MDKKIMFTGAQGTGKTTLIYSTMESYENTPVSINGIRDLIKKYKLDHSENSNETTQTKIFNYYKKLVRDNKTLVCDRSLIDVFAYTLSLYKHFKVSEDYFKKQERAFAKFVKENKDITYCYFPIEFKVVNDGVRSIDEEYRTEIDTNIKAILKTYNIDYIEISGSMDDRKNILYTIL